MLFWAKVRKKAVSTKRNPFARLANLKKRA
jgi:hypothetical protein